MTLVELDAATVVRPRPRPRLRRRRWWQRRPLLATALAALLLLLLWSLLAAGLAAWHLQAARAGVEQLRGAERQDLATLQLRVEKAADRAGSARALVRQPGPALVARVPVLGRTLAAERDTALAAAEALDAARRLVPLAAQVQIQDGAVDLEAMGRLTEEFGRSAQAVQGRVDVLEAAELGLTPSPVRAGVEQAREALGGLADGLARGEQLLTAAQGLAGGAGPRTLVLAVMNNAELRGSGGYAGSIATVRTDGGRLQVEPFQDVDAIAAEPQDAVRVPAPPDFARRFGPFLADTTLWKQVLLSADAPSSASVLCEVAKVAPGIPCDGVILMDIPALAELMTLSGPVTLPSGEQVGGDELVEALLVEAYEDVPADDAAQAARRAGLRAAADAALVDLLDRPVDGVEIVRVLLRAAQGRHVAVWSARPDEQEALVEAGASATADPRGADDLSLIAFNQLVAGKLDYYVDREVTVHAQVSTETARVVQLVTMTLDSPPGLPEYVQGVEDGRLVGLLDIAVPLGATVLQVLRDGAPVPYGLTTDTGSQRVVIEPDLAPTQTGRWGVVYEVPVVQGQYELQLMPQPLARDARLRLDVEGAQGYELVDGPVRYEGPYDRARTIDVQARRD